MSRTVTAFFDSREEAQAAKSRLESSNIDANRIRIVDQSSSSGGSTGERAEPKGFFASLGDMFMPDEDAHAYQEGINRGGFLLCAQVDEQEADQAIRLLEESDSVDFDAREQSWRNDGWTGWTGERETAGLATGATAGGQNFGEQNFGGRNFGNQTFAAGQTAATPGAAEMSRTVAEERVPLVEEELQVGKREVERGGARVRSYVREVPVHEQVTLRDEHVSVERRPVDEPLGQADLRSGDFLRDREIEMTETHEEAMIDKQARVTEEVVVRKTAESHVEQIDDTVRRTEVDIEEDVTARSDRSAFGGFDTDESRTEAERSDFERSGSDPVRRP